MTPLKVLQEVADFFLHHAVILTLGDDHKRRFMYFPYWVEANENSQTEFQLHGLDHLPKVLEKELTELRGSTSLALSGAGRTEVIVVVKNGIVETIHSNDASVAISVLDYDELDTMSDEDAEKKLKEMEPYIDKAAAFKTIYEV